MSELTLKDKTAIVGVGATPYYRRGASAPSPEPSADGPRTAGSSLTT